MEGLLTDLYELTMAAGYFAAGKTREVATFEIFLRRLPRNRDFVIVAGIADAVSALRSLHFTAAHIDYLRSLPQFERAQPGFFEYLAAFRFTGDVWAVPEGTTLFAGEPVMTVRAPIIEAQIPETFLLSTVTFQTLIATKAARMVRAARGRPVVEFGTRRAHSPHAGVLGARAAYLGGCAGTSNTLAGFRYGIPVMGTAAHSWVMAFAGETDAFRRLQELLGPHTVHLVDTYDAIEGTRRAASLGRPLWGVRIDSGDFDSLSRAARAILDQAGLPDAKIMASGDLDERRILELVEGGAPIDAFGVGTELATSQDAPAMGAVYKLVEIEGRPTAKRSPDKASLPGAKQIFRFPDRDVVGLASEPVPEGAEALLKPAPSTLDLPAARTRAATPAAPRRVEYSEALKSLAERC
ncbi:MAG: nicotinate phosphoribosyltransferase [Bryobacteraceae bacterium]